ncbi:hypothetical protein WDJ50_04855 [Deinococcus sp. VB142]|uniref:Uncharacterized protein n=1 Tax=Deinococcus sp. VB142 TaxID=3112952 RepID=A0AAU6Q541_9DEIO
MYCSDLDLLTRAELQEQYSEHGNLQHSFHSHTSRRRRFSRALHWLERRLTLPERQRVAG